MRKPGASLLLVTGLLSWSAADAAPRGERRARPAPAAGPARAVIPKAAPVAAPRRTAPSALRPEFSEGEWAGRTPTGLLSPRDLASAEATVANARGRVENLSMTRVEERNLRTPPVLPASSLDAPLAVSPGGVDLPAGFEFSPIGLAVTQPGR